ncbi:MAG: DUF6524 family protein [Thioalkalispiraceae bacterium]|jgi:hypothetical protein
MSYKPITWTGVALRFVFALVLVFATYNPSGYSFYHWGIKQISDFSVLKLFVAIVLLIGWTVFVRATLRSLGAFGLFLAFAFFGTMIWLIVDVGIIPVDNIDVVLYLTLFIASAILTTGMTWSHIRRRLSGQVDMDDIDEED